MARIPLESARLVVDLGCGTGCVTQSLARRFVGARIIGVDHSEEMLQVARERDREGITWMRAAIQRWVPDEAPDLIYSNAALHWVDGHEELFPLLLSRLAPAGCLAVQMPLSFDQPAQRLVREVLGGQGERNPFGSSALRQACSRRRVMSLEDYHDLLTPRVARLDVWSTTYLHELAGDDPVFEWMRSTTLRPVLQGLSGEERDAYEAILRARLREAYSQRPSGRTLFPFSRLFLVASVAP
ncbi:MAG: methyltransferase domain-containing protein [Planctomycetes bacterium]|nr:methyltransferase domain-containing protein [Planctomycetota bacterium]MCB9891931.1 methyltransferase domain-containing protein [Planctomycetota bacterium]